MSKRSVCQTHSKAGVSIADSTIETILDLTWLYQFIRPRPNTSNEKYALLFSKVDFYIYIAVLPVGSKILRNVVGQMKFV